MGFTIGATAAGFGLQDGRELRVPVEPDDRHGEEHADGDHTGQRHGGNAAVKCDRRTERQLVGPEGAQKPDAHCAEQHSENPAAEREKYGFDNDLARDVAAARTKRTAHGEFLGAAMGPDQEQIDEIDAPDEQEKEHAGLQQHQGRFDGADVVVVQEADGRVVTGGLQLFRVGQLGQFVEC